MITQLSSNLIAVEIPIDAKSMELHKLPSPTLVFMNVNTCRIKLQKGNYEILGECTKDNVSFDVTHYIRCRIGRWYQDYTNDNILCGWAKDSFISLLQSKGCILSNKNKFVILKKK